MSDGYILLGILFIGGIMFVPVTTLILVLVMSGRLSELERSLKQIAEQLKTGAPLPGVASEKREAGRVTPTHGVVAAKSVESPAPAIPVAAAVSSEVKVAVASPPVSGQAAERAAAESLPSEVKSGVAEGEREPSGLDQVLSKAWNWFVVGEAYRKPGQSWEFAVATNWLLRAGIMIVLAGVAFFLKYSIERGLMGPMGRVSLSMASGVVLIVVGLRMLFKRYHLLGQGLAGAGFVMLYFSFYAASSMYHLISLGLAFVMMAAVTASAGVLSVVYSSMGIALLGLLGGYATPLMVSQDGGSQLLFYSYILLLGVGVLGLSLVRRWPVLNGLGMLAAYTLIFLYCAEHRGTSVLFNDMVATSAVHLLYLFAVVAHYLRGKERSGAFEWGAICLNCVLYSTWVFVLFRPVFGSVSVGMLSLGLSAVYLALVYFGERRAVGDKQSQLFFTAFAALFLVLAPVFILSKELLTFAWSLLALLIVWIGRRSGERSMVKAGIGLFMLTIVRWFTLDLDYFYMMSRAGALEGWEFWRQFGIRLVLLGVMPAALCGAWRMVRGHRHAGKVLAVILVQCLIIVTKETELVVSLHAADFEDGGVTLSWVLFAFGLLFAGIRVGGRWLRWCGLGLFVVAIGKLLLHDLEELETLYRIVAFIATGVVLVMGSFVYLKYKHLFESERGGTAGAEVEEQGRLACSDGADSSGSGEAG